MNKAVLRAVVAVVIAGVVEGSGMGAARAADEPGILPLSTQVQGLPYTRSARPRAMAKIQDFTAVFAGSRYGYVKGHKVRLDDADWRAEAVERDGVVYVPASFARLLSTKEVTFDTAPAYLAEKWVYTPDRTELAAGVVGGEKWVALAEVAKQRGLKVFAHPSGLLVVGDRQIRFTDDEAALLQSVITMFDTPEKFADPDIATQSMEVLKRQGKWTNYVKVTPEQMKVLQGPETNWEKEMTPLGAFDLSGFNTALLGSKVPPPGVYPRILFSPEDVPMIAARVKGSKLGQMSLIEMEELFKKGWWDPKTPDGQVFEKLVSGNVQGLEFQPRDSASPGSAVQRSLTWDPQHLFKGQKPSIYNSHIYYVPQSLTAMATYCLLTGNDVRGRQTAAAIANYYRLREPFIDAQMQYSDSEFGSDPAYAGDAQTSWRRSSHPGQHMDLAFALDFSGKWMTADEKEQMRRVIAKLTYGRRSFGQDGPARWRDINWMNWDFTHLLNTLAIEGLEGYDREVYDVGKESVRAFCEWGVDSSGHIFESSGKTTGGMQFQILSMIALARRGDNYFGHPHWRKMLQGQVQVTSPTGKVSVNSGTQYVPFSHTALSFQAVDEIKAFFPDDRSADYILSQAANRPETEISASYLIPQEFDAKTYPAELAKRRLRLPSISYPGMTRSVVYDTDFQPTTRAQLNLPLNFNDPVYGMFSAYSDRSTDATWMNMQVRANHWLGAGHHHADAGMFHFSALGVDWITESRLSQIYEGKYHNHVIVDGVSTPGQFPARAEYLGAMIGEKGSAATADLTYAYTYCWTTQPPLVITPEFKAMGWELEPSADNLKKFAGSARYKMRPWWPTYNFSNYIATSRAKFNPMQYVYRTVGLVRGAHPYGVVVDDLKKDGLTHLYQWTAMMSEGVWQADVAGLGKGQVVLARQWPAAKATADKALLTPKPGDALVLVCSLGIEGSGDAAIPLVAVSTEDGPADKLGKPQPYDRLAISRRATEVAYRVLLVPFRYGEKLPQITYDPATSVARVAYSDQVDEISFVVGADQRTGVSVTRDGKQVLISK